MIIRKITHKQVLSIITGILLFHITSANADCSRGDIDHYLEKGFSPDQITKLCGEVKVPDSQPVPVERPVEIASPQDQPPESTYLKIVIDAENIEVNDDSLVLFHDRCFLYGAENSIGIQEEICTQMQTTIAREGLQIVRVTNPIPLLRDPELVVKSRISREIVFNQKLDKYNREAFEQDYPSTPKTLNIALKKGHKPTEAAKKIKQLIK